MAAFDDDDERVRRIKQQDEKSLDELWDYIYTRCLVLARRHGQDEQCTTDVALEAYGRITKKVGQFAFQCPFWGWCNTIVIREMYRWLKKNQRRMAKQIPLDNAYALVSDSAEQELKADSNMLRSRIQPCLDALDSRAKAIIESLYFGMMSPEEVAEKFSLTRGNVNVIALRARRSLLNCLQQQGFDSLDTLLSL